MPYYLSRDPRHTVIGSIRAIGRLIRFLATFASCVIIVLGARAVSTRVTRGPGSVRLRQWLGRRLSRAAGIWVKRTGRRPATGGVIVANHLSWADSFVFLGELGARFVAMDLYRRIPVVGQALSAAGVLYIERSRLRDVHSVGRRIGRAVRRGELVMFFPEADTSRGADVKPFRGALLEPAAGAGAPAWWCALRYETPPGWPPASVVAAWADWTPLLLHAWRFFHPPRITARIHYGTASEKGRDRKETAAALHAAVSGAFEPMEQLDPAELARIHVPPRKPQAKF